jgi:twinkle protein
VLRSKVEVTETEFVSQLISKFKRFAKAHDVAVFMVAHPTKISSQGQMGGKEPLPGLCDVAGSAHWRNKADAGIVVYRDFDEGHTLVLARKIRRQPTCGEPGSVKFGFISAERRFTAFPDSFASAGSSAPRSGGLRPAA